MRVFYTQTGRALGSRVCCVVVCCLAGEQHLAVTCKAWQHQAHCRQGSAPQRQGHVVAPCARWPRHGQVLQSPPTLADVQKAWH